MTIELPPDFIALAARDLRDPADLALQVLTNYTLSRAWDDEQAEPSLPVVLSDK